MNANTYQMILELPMMEEDALMAFWDDCIIKRRKLYELCDTNDNDEYLTESLGAAIHHLSALIEAIDEVVNGEKEEEEEEA